MVESAFGILANRFRVLLNSINLSAEKVQIITQCCVVLHNFLIAENPLYISADNMPDNLLENLTTHQGGNRSSNSARQIRNEFKDFVNNIGARDWQNEQVNRHKL